MKKLQPLSFAIIFLLCLISHVPVFGASPNLLTDPSFENGGINGPFSDDWHVWGGATTETVYQRAGNYSAKLWGNNTGDWNYSGFYQDIPAESEGWYEATAYVRQNSDDHIRGENECYLKLEFYADDLLKEYKSIRSLHAKSASKQFIMLSTGRVQAPPGTTVARFVIIYSQDPDSSEGAVLIDEASLRKLPTY